MELNLRGKTALVTGGSRGIGAAICQALAAEGVSTGVNYRASAGEAEDLARSITETHGAPSLPVKADLAVEQDIVAMFDRIEERLGPVDLLVNNAAVCPSGPLESYSVEEWERTFRVNVTGAYIASREHIKRLRARRATGRIVNIASQAAFLGSTSGHLPYDASKGALISMTRAMAREVAEEGILINAIAPGMVMTEMVAGIWEQRKDFYLSRIPMKRIALPEEVARIVVFLASDAASFMTSTTLDATGGLMMR